MPFALTSFDKLPGSPLLRAIVVGAVLLSLAACGFGVVAWPAAFWHGYLAAFCFWTSVSLGCLGLALLHPLTGGRWGWAISRELSAGAAGIPLLACGIVPLLWGAAHVFPWARDLKELNPHQQIYFASWFVLARLGLVWAIWSALAMWVRDGFRRAARHAESRLPPRRAALGVILFWITVTTAAVDAMMSLTPEWTSSMFGAMHVVGCAVAALSWALLVRHRRLVSPHEEHQASHDLGNLLMAFNLMWVYLSFSQYLIVWSGDVPHEVSWYADRQSGVAGFVGTILLGLHFVVPFLLLLSVDVKRQASRLAFVAGLVLAMRLVDFGWTILPANSAADGRSVLSLAANAIVLGCLWLAVFQRNLQRLPHIDWNAVTAVDKAGREPSVEALP